MIARLRDHPAATGATVLLLGLTTAFWTAGALFPEELPRYAESTRQITGMVLMLIVLPAYLTAAALVAQRRSQDLVEQLRPMLADGRDADRASAAIGTGLRETWWFGAPVGIAMGLLNTQPLYALMESPIPHIEGAISFGQLFLWLIVGLVLGMRIASARAFARLGAVVEFDLFRLEGLRPLARSGVIDVVVIAGALAFSPLQALDAAFRWYNYSFALIVSIPSAITFVTWPLWRIHRRIAHAKRVKLEEIEEIVECAPTNASPDDLARLEMLLAHRDRIRELPTWPLGTALLSRIFLYLIIPPLAWVGAALVEMLVSRVVSG